MIENKNKPAYPAEITELVEARGKIKEAYPGLSKREYFAGLAMQGLLASWGNHDCNSYEEIAADAVLAADALLLELSKPQP